MQNEPTKEERERAKGWARDIVPDRVCGEEGHMLLNLARCYLWCEERLAALERVAEVGRNGLGGWMSAAIDDPKVCAEMKADIQAWFAAYEALDALEQKKSQ